MEQITKILITNIQIIIATVSHETEKTMGETEVT